MTVSKPITPLEHQERRTNAVMAFNTFIADQLELKGLSK